MHVEKVILSVQKLSKHQNVKAIFTIFENSLFLKIGLTTRSETEYGPAMVSSM